MKKVQTVKHNTSGKQVAIKPYKKAEYFDEYFDFFEFIQKPVTERWVEALGKELINWAHNNSRALTIHQFFAAKGIDTTDYKRWRKRFEKFDRAYLFALKAIGERREVGAVDKEYDSAMVRWTMPKYEPKELTFTEIEEWRAGLKHTEDSKTPTKIEVHLDSFKKGE